MSKRFSVPEDYRALDWLSEGDYDYMNDRLVYVRRQYGESGRLEGKIMLRDPRGERQVSAGGKAEGGPALSPDGQTLAFLSSGEGGRQIWLYDLASGTSRRLTDVPYAPREIRWSPTGESIAWLAAVPAGDQKAPDPFDPVAIEQFGYKFDGVGYAISTAHTHLWLTDTGTGKSVQLTDGDCEDILHNWSPDGRSLVFASSRAQNKADSLGLDLFTVPRSGGQPKQISCGRWVTGYPVAVRPFFTPDGEAVVSAFLESQESAKGYPPTHLHRINIQSGEDTDLFPADSSFEAASFPYNPPMARCGERAVLSSDGKRVLFLSGKDGGCNLYSAELYAAGQPIVPVLEGAHCICGLAAAHNGQVMVALGDALTAGAFDIIDEQTGRTVRRLAQAGALTQEVSLSVPHTLWFDTLDGESRVQGWVLPPQGIQPGRRYPAVLYIHGGPHPYYTYSLDYEMQCLAGAGFAVLYCNPRGSSGYGHKHQNLERAMDGSAYMDLLQFVDEACRQYDFIDPGRIGVTGGSYGGYMTNYMATHSKRFNAYVTQRSVSSDLISYGSSDMHTPAPGDIPFVAFMLDKLRSSTVTKAQNIDRPLLILHGTEDYRCPVEGAHQLFVAVKDCHPDLPVKMILFPHNAHGIPEYLPNKLLYHREMIQWFQKYL